MDLTKNEKIPNRPVVKITHFGNVMSINITLSNCAIFITEVYGEILCVSSDPAESSFLDSFYIKKRCHIACKLEITSNKKVIAKYRLTN